MADFRVIEVHDAQIDVLVGHFTVYASRTGESYTFEYSDEFLSHPRSYDLDTELTRASRSVSASAMFSAFTDCAPDRWGRKLIERAANRRVTESDYVLGVDDTLRQGALRFRENGRWLSARGAVPKIVDLPKIVALSQEIGDADDYRLHELSKRLLSEGTSALGGAHPKATVRDGEGRLYLAKFAVDHADQAALDREYATMLAAGRAGLSTVPPRRVGGVFLVPRFDRDENGGRIAYASAKTLLGSREGETVDYLDIAESLEGNGAAADLPEMWRRIAFGTLIHNTDDHARNHGVVRRGVGWRLSPVFDVNPTLNPNTRHATTLNGRADAEGMSVALAETADVFGVSATPAREFLGRVVDMIGDSGLSRDIAEFARDLAARSVSVLGPVPSAPLSSDKCVYCGKLLSAADSVARGYGKDCGARHGKPNAPT